MAMPLWSNGIREMFSKLGMAMINQWFNDFTSWHDSQFDTKGDMTLSTNGKGFHLRSPNGSKFFVTISNAGTWTITPE